MPLTPWERLAGEYWPDVANPALRGMYCVGCGHSAPLVYRRWPAGDHSAPLVYRRWPAGETLKHPTGFSFERTVFVNGRGSRQGMQCLGRELFAALAEVTERLNNGTFTESWAREELARIEKQTWPMPQRPDEPFVIARYNEGGCISRGYPPFRAVFSRDWLEPAKGADGRPHERFLAFKRPLLPAVFDLLFLANAGLLTEAQLEGLVTGLPRYDPATGLLTATRVTTTII